jgi:hypothetical protein
VEGGRARRSELGGQRGGADIHWSEACGERFMAGSKNLRFFLCEVNCWFSNDLK